MRPRMLGLLASVHLLGALAIFAATLWIGGRGVQQPQQPPLQRPTTTNSTPRQLPEAPPAAQPSARDRVSAEPDWLRQALARDLAPSPLER